MPTPSRPLTYLLDAIEEYRTTDKGYDTLAAEFNVPKRVLRAELISQGLLRTQREGNNLARVRGEATRRKKRRNGLPEQVICEMYERGMSELELSRAYDVSRHTIGRILDGRGVIRRGVREANRLRMERMPVEERIRNSAAARRAARSKGPLTEEELLRRAASREGRVPTNAIELLYAAWLKERGIPVTFQKAIGKYNADLGADPVAVEIFGGNWHGYGKHAETFAERSRYILDQGWALVIVWVLQHDKLLAEPSADYLARFIEQARRDPSLRGQYRVIWGDGQEAAIDGLDLDQLARVPSRRRARNAGT